MNFKLNYIQKICMDGEDEWRFTSAVRSRRGLKGGLKVVKQRTTEITLFNESYRGNINVFQDICRYNEFEG